MDEQKTFYYKVNVRYPVGVRFNNRDTIGRVLNTSDPYVGVEEKGLRDFKRANAFAIKEGLIMPTAEPNLDGESVNSIDDDQAAGIVKNFFVLKKTLAELTSPPIIQKLLDVAKETNRGPKTIKLIEEKLAEYITEEDLEAPYVMRGVE